MRCLSALTLRHSEPDWTQKTDAAVQNARYRQGETKSLSPCRKVGRPSVREALAALKRKGLVQISNGERARVSRPSANQTGLKKQTQLFKMRDTARVRQKVFRHAGKLAVLRFVKRWRR
jgi:DNA-binding FadR family transcriptional regulator